MVSLAGLAAISHPRIARADTPVLPQGGTVVAGAASIARNGPDALDITTATQRTAINWQSFSIGIGDTVTINQPNASALTLNQVTGSDPSRIFGSLKSNGQVVLANSNGIWFGPGSHVDVAAIVASTATASTAALSAFAKGGALMLDQAGNARASIVNDGTISIAQEGLAGLVAPGVANNGVIAARMGHVVLASGTVATLDFYGDGLISFAVGGTVTARPTDPAGKALTAAVSNSGTIAAQGGTVLLTAATAKTVIDNTVNMSGVVVASAVSGQGGEIDLDGGTGTTTVSGQLLAGSTTAAGGAIHVTGQRVQLASTARLDAGGTTGGTIAVGGGVHGAGPVVHAIDVAIAGGASLRAPGTTGAGGTISVWSDGTTRVAASITALGALPGGFVETSGHVLDIGGISVTASEWLLDPYELDIDSAAAAGISSALATGGVTIVTSASGSSGGFGTANANGSDVVGGDIVVQAPISWSSRNTLSLNANYSIDVGAAITVSGAGSLLLNTNNGGSFNVNAPLSFAATGALSINGAGYTLINSIAGLNAMSLVGDYALASDLDFGSIPNFTPIGSSSSSPFAGTFEGLGHTIGNLTETDASGAGALGLFGFVQGGAISHLTFTGASITEAGTGAATQLGILAGSMIGGSVTGVSTQGSVAGTAGTTAGGMIGFLGSGASVTASTSAATVSGGNAGGLVGISAGGVIGASDASGFVTTTTGRAGGLVGYNYTNGTIIDSFATGTVSATGANATIGGLAGANGQEDAVSNYNSTLSSGTIINAYATGAVSDSGDAGYVGGLVGYNIVGITNAHATGSVLGAGNVGGLVGHNSNVFFQFVGTITNSYASGPVFGGSGTSPLNGFSPDAGGLVGFNEGLITGSAAFGSVNGSFQSGVAENVGGLVGENFAVTITNSYATGPVSGNGNLGGLVGLNEAAVSFSYAVGSVSGTGSFGGLVAQNSGQVAASYWTTDTTGQLSSAGGTGLTSAQLISGTLPGNFSSAVWVATPGALPYLSWQSGAPSLPGSASSETVSGTAFSAYGSTFGLSGAGLDIVIDGQDYVATTNGTGGYSKTIAATGSGAHEVTIVLTSGGSGSAFYDETTQPLSGINVYSGSVLLATEDISIAAAVNRLSQQAAHLTAGAGALDVSVGQSGIGITNGIGLVIEAAGTSASPLTVDLSSSSVADPLSALTVLGSRSIVFGTSPIYTTGNMDIASAGSIAFEGAIIAVGTAATLTVNAGGDVYFAQSAGTETQRLRNLTIRHANNVTVAHTAGALLVDLGQGRSLTINETATTDPVTGQIATTDATLWVDGFSTGGSASYDPSGRLASLVAGIAGTLSTGLHSLESDGDVSIFATAVDGRIVAGSNGANGTAATAGTLTVAAADVTNADLVATRSANIAAIDTIANTNITANVANVSAANLDSSNVAAGVITVNVGGYSGDQFSSPSLPNFGGGDPTRGGNSYNGQPVTNTIVQLASLTVPTNATNPKVGGSTDAGVSSADGDDSGGSSADRKKKNERKDKNGVEHVVATHTASAVRTYDAANQFLNKLLKSKTP